VGLAQVGDRFGEPPLQREPLERVALGSDLLDAAGHALARAPSGLAAPPRAGDPAHDGREERPDLRACPSGRRPRERGQPRLLHHILGRSLAHEGTGQREEPGLLAQQRLGIDR
jgi:hypothetical protein